MAGLPSRISRFEIESPLRAGGMGAVYLARDPAIDRRVAIKLLHPALAEDELLRRFAQEARALGRLSHPNIVVIHEFGEFEGAPFIVMEYLRGETLADLIARRQSVPIAQKLAWIEQACAALGYAHDADIIHRDLKPSNLMIDDRGTIKVVDFGIARIVGATATRASMVMGTPAYMSPEQIEGEPIDRRTDVFSLGAVLYEVLSYQPAFPGPSVSAVMHRILHGEPQPLAQLVPDIDPALPEVVAGALRKDRTQRHPDMRVFEQAVAAVRQRLERAGGEPTLAKPRQRQPAVPAESIPPQPPPIPADSTDPQHRAPAPSEPSAPFAPPLMLATPTPRRSFWLPWLGGLAALLISVFMADYFLGRPSPPRDMETRDGSVATRPPRADPRVPAVRWAYIPPGTFQMGCVPGDTECQPNETPRHPVTLSRAFELMTTEVSVAMARALLASVPQQPAWSRDDHPVVNVDWDRASAACLALGGRLPTEAEWEYAARGGVDGVRFVWGDHRTPIVTLRPAANVADKARSPRQLLAMDYDDGFAESAPVATFLPNAFGLHDMAGNVWEWMAGWSGAYPGATTTDPRGPESSPSRGARGGSWHDDPFRISFRLELPRSSRSEFTGFRCAREVLP